MDVVPLLAHKEEEPFRAGSWQGRGLENHTYREVELLGMGQSIVRGNQIQDSVYQDWNVPNSSIKLTIQEILQIKDVFKMLARLTPEDQCISKQTFLHYFPLDGMLGQRLFGIFDANKDEKIHAGEFLSGISLCLHGTMTDKCNLLFRMFDLDEDQGVSQDELYRMLKPTLKAADSLSRKTGFNDDKEEEEEDLAETARLLVHEAFEECDLEQTGKLSIQNFQSWFSGHRELVKAVFNYPFQALINRNSRYEDLKDNKRHSRLQPQTWMSEHNDKGSPPVLEQTFHPSNARYLWSPLFPDTGSKFPPCRSKHAAVLYYGKIYIFGGRGKASTLRDIWQYTLSENRWDQVKLQSDFTMPVLEEHTAVVYKNHAYIFGGLFATDKKTPLWSYEFETSRWKDLSHSKFQKEPLNRRGHSAVIYRDSMLLFGGILDNGHASNELWRYNFTTFRWHLLSPKEGTETITARHSHTAVVHNSCIWIFGGVDTKSRKNDLWAWDFELFTWKKIKQKGGPLPIAKHTASKMGPLMVVFGGEQSEPRNETWTFNFESFEWKRITPLSSITPSPRIGHVTITLSPYSVHSGPVSYSRPLTAKSAPDRSTGLRNNDQSFQHFHRTASADSILDFNDKPLTKGKSLDLSYELDNLAYDKSLPDITADPKSERHSERFETGNTRVIQVQPSSEASLQTMEHIPQFIQKNWAIVVVAGKGKLCTDLYKTSVDIWRCDIGPDVGMQYLTESATRSKKREATQYARYQYRSRTMGQSQRDKSTSCAENDTPDEEQTSWKTSSPDNDRLIITDLTINETEFSTANDPDRGSLLR